MIVIGFLLSFIVGFIMGLVVAHDTRKDEQHRYIK